MTTWSPCPRVPCCSFVGALQTASEAEFEGDDAKEWLKSWEASAPEAYMDFKNGPRGHSIHLVGPVSMLARALSRMRQSGDERVDAKVSGDDKTESNDSRHDSEQADTKDKDDFDGFRASGHLISDHPDRKSE